LNAAQTSQVCELLKDPPPGEEAFLLHLLTERVPPGVDEAAYVKAGFLAAVAKEEVRSPLIPPLRAVELLGTMLGGYNVQVLLELLQDRRQEIAEAAARALSHTLLVFDAFHDVLELSQAGNVYARQVLESWAAGEWFTAKPPLAEAITVTVFKVAGEINTDDLSPGRPRHHPPRHPPPCPEHVGVAGTGGHSCHC
jgi:aconitate hydratase 2/2-methylisocitrate dehydratase